MRPAVVCLLVAFAVVAVYSAEARDLQGYLRRSKGKAKAGSHAGAKGPGKVVANAGTNTKASKYNANSDAWAYAANYYNRAAADAVSKASGYKPKTESNTGAYAGYYGAGSYSGSKASNKGYYGKGKKATAGAGSVAKGYGATALTNTKAVVNKHGAASRSGSHASNHGAAANANAGAKAFGPGAKADTKTYTKVHHGSASSKSSSSARSGH